MITFSKAITTAFIGNAYNDSIAIFRSDLPKVPVKAEVFVGSEIFEITPDNQGNFKFNFKNAFRVLVGNNFKDSFTLLSEIMFEDSSLFWSIPTSMKIHFSDNTFDASSVVQAPLIRKVVQIGNEMQNSFRSTSGVVILSGVFGVYFEGYPYEISTLALQQQTIVNNTKGISHLLPVNTIRGTRIRVGKIKSQYANRLVTQGFTQSVNPCYDSVVLNDDDFLGYGMNDLSINGQSIIIEKRKNCNGTYLKWFDVTKGCWSYWLFNAVFREVLQAKTKDTIKVEYDGINTELVSGKDASKDRTILADGLTKDEFDLIKTISRSPKVELWEDKQWQSVLLVDSDTEVTNTKRTSYKFSGTIRINQFSY
jgi:hypothetical protein